MCMDWIENGADISGLSGSGNDTDRVAYHNHCQQRTLGVDRHTEAVLDHLGYDVLTSDVECCGMAGSFGYNSEYYELSVAVGNELVDQFTTPDARDRTVVASGTSCLDQLDSLLDRPSTHPIELIVPQSSL
jgi:Fe-S oxidoreductase